MSPAERGQLLDLAGRLRRMPLSHRRDPERPHVERSELVRALEQLAAHSHGGSPPSSPPRMDRGGRLSERG